MIINHIISLGNNCDALFILKGLQNNIRVPGPVDNCLGNHNSIKTLLDGTFLDDIIKENITYENDNNRFLNNSGLNIQHNDFTQIKYKISLRERLLHLFQYIYNSQFDNSLWFIISISPFESSIDELYQEISNLPIYIKSKLIIAQGRKSVKFGIIHNIREYPVFNIYDEFQKGNYQNEYIEEWSQLDSIKTVELFNDFLKNNLDFYNKLNNSNWDYLKLNSK